jgi:hypothetical protein
MIFLVSFGNTPNYVNVLLKLQEQALKLVQLKLFDRIRILTEKNLDKSFMDLHGEFISKNKRGFGYWIWKSYIIKKTLEIMKDDDIVIYLDAGCSININDASIKRYNEYIDMVKSSDVGLLAFQLNSCLEKSWVKMDLVKHLNATPEMLETGQIAAGVFFVKKNKTTVDLFNKYYETSCHYNLLNDTPSVAKNDPCFREHRHDQSIFSLLSKLNNAIIIPDETYSKTWKDEKILGCPFWMTRSGQRKK